MKRYIKLFRGRALSKLGCTNMNSVRLAEKLGYEFDHEYVAYEVTGDASPHETIIDAI